MPWPDADGRPAYVVADPERPGPVSRRADAIEGTQLEMAGVLLTHARQLVDEAGLEELRYLVAEMTRALSGILQIASRVKH